jgi:hypothetical protein
VSNGSSEGVDLRRPDEMLAVFLAEQGFAHFRNRFTSRGDAWARALSVATQARRITSGGGDLHRLEVVGEFNLPPEQAEQRDFQPLHIDFGIPRVAADAVDIALYTGLYIDADRAGSGTSTRLVPLHRILRQRTWPPAPVVGERIRSTAHDRSATEGILARIVACIDQTWDLPAKDDDFLCGMEFNSIDEERRFYRRHGINLNLAEQAVTLAPGELLLFDNLAIAHGRSGRRNTRELRQLCIGIKSADRSVQAEVVESLAARFTT